MTEIELREIEAGFTNSNIKIKALQEETATLQKETAALHKKNEQESAKTEALFKRLGIYVGNIGDNNGATAEEYFFNALSDNPVFGGIKYDKVGKNIHAINKRLEDEYDIVLYNGDSIAIIECKYKAHETDLNKLIDKKVGNFRLLFPDFKDYTIFLGLASFAFYPELEALAKQKGVAILKQKGGFAEIDASNLRAY